MKLNHECTVTVLYVVLKFSFSYPGLDLLSMLCLLEIKDGIILI